MVKLFKDCRLEDCQNVNGESETTSSSSALAHTKKESGERANEQCEFNGSKLFGLLFEKTNAEERRERLHTHTHTEAEAEWSGEQKRERERQSPR